MSRPKQYQIFNGTTWVDICECELHVVNVDGELIKIDPKGCPTRYWDGETWCLIECTSPCILKNPLSCEEASSRVTTISSLSFTPALCLDVAGAVGCAGLVAFIPITLSPSAVGIELGFASGLLASRENTVWDGLDIVDVCQEQVLGGLGFFGTGLNDNCGRAVCEGNHLYDKFIYYDKDANGGLGGWENITSEVPPLTVEVSGSYQIEGVVESRTFLSSTQDTLVTSGYNSVPSIPYGDPNKVFITADNLTFSGDESTRQAYNYARILNWTRPLPPVGGYPAEETFLVRVFAHPITGSTNFFIVNTFSCRSCLENFNSLTLSFPEIGSSDYTNLVAGYNPGGGDLYTWLATALPDFQVNFISSEVTFSTPYAYFALNIPEDTGSYTIEYSVNCGDILIPLPAFYSLDLIVIEAIAGQMFLRINVVNFSNYVAGLEVGENFCIHISKSC